MLAHIEPDERPLFKQLIWSGSTPLMVYQPEECITFSKVDEDKLPCYIYKQGASKSENFYEKLI